MGIPVFIGDELTASGFHLGGADIRVVDETNVEEAFDDAGVSTDLIILSAGSASRLPPDKLATALKALRPLLIVVPDAVGTSPPDLRRHVRKTLDLE